MLFSKFIRIALISTLAANLTSCGKNSESDDTERPEAGENSPPLPPTSTLSPTPAPTEADVDFELDAILREFATSESDRGALFIIKPSVNQVLTIKEVRGPRFLGGVHKLTIDETSVAKIFSKTSNPLSQERRRQILEKYRGATAVYFEGYPGRLCSSTEWSVVVYSTLNGMELQTNFTFAANPSQTEDCSLYSRAMITSSFKVVSQ